MMACPSLCLQRLLPRHVRKIFRELMWPVVHTLPFCPPDSCRPLPTPLQTNPLSPQTRLTVQAAQSFVVLGDVGDRGPAQYHVAQEPLRFVVVHSEARQQRSRRTVEKQLRTQSEAALKAFKSL